MKSFLPIVCLLCISQNILGHSIRKALPFYDEVSYQDITNINGSCFPLDSCQQSRTEDPILEPTSHEKYTCNCNTQCSEYGTCCIDSPYRVKTPIQKCIDTNYENEYIPYKKLGTYMVYRCPDNTNSDSVWKNLCEKEWSGEDDILMISPVSSLETNLTYKNYYCFRCHETTDNYESWSLNVQSIYNITTEKRDYSFFYDNAFETWMVGVDDNRISIPVNVSFYIPYVGFTPTTCDLHLISDCHYTWTDKRVRDKCLAYTAVIQKEISSYESVFDQEISSYKNVHCALCNYVSVDNLTCFKASTFNLKDVFDFRYLITFHWGDDKVGNNEKCDNGHLWDPYSKKCRKISCANPEYVIKGNKCAPP